MEYLIWIIYIPGWFYLIGLPWSILVGLGFLGWLQLRTIWQFFELISGKGDFLTWVEKVYFVNNLAQPFIFFWSILFGIVPFLNVLAATLGGIYSNLSYYHGNYEILVGPTKEKCQKQ